MGSEPGSKKPRAPKAAPSEGKTIRASLTVWGAGPGMGGTSFIKFVPDGDDFRVFGGGSAIDGREELGTVPVAAGWRGRVSFIVDEAEPAHEDHLPEDVRVTGAKGLEADLLAQAWSGPEGAALIRTLMSLSDEELLCLSNAGALGTQDACDGLTQLKEIFDYEDEPVLSVLRQSLADREFGWDTVLARATEITAAREAEDERAEQAKQAALLPFADEIERLLAEWWRVSGGATSMASQWVMNARKRVVQEFLEDHVRRHGLLPSGVHRLPFNFMGKAGYVDLDIDALRAA